MSTKLNAYTAYIEDLCDEFDLILRAPNEGYESYNSYNKIKFAIIQHQKLSKYLDEVRNILVECPELSSKLPPLG